MKEPKDSDLVKLTREFESLTARIAANDAGVAQCHETIEEAHQKASEVSERAMQVVRQLQRERRTLDAQYENVQELLRDCVTPTDRLLGRANAVNAISSFKY